MSQEVITPSMPETTPTKTKASKRIVVLVVTALALLTGAGYATLQHRSSNQTETVSTATRKIATNVSVNSEGFSPATLTIKRGQSVIWENTDDQPHQIASDPYPQADGLPGLTADGPILTNETYAFTFDKVGTFTYYDHLNPEKFHGTIVVK
ncbi:cupredoxin domain-containing protein [Candidatus Saccharibacteria bacterium]|nr:MAG: cupredoxin domain-containing protein [Candidatus Saccharibacteria bacterium]